jgi:hypothetical protein
MAVRAIVESGASFARLRVPSEAASLRLPVEPPDREPVSSQSGREAGSGSSARS